MNDAPHLAEELLGKLESLLSEHDKPSAVAEALHAVETGALVVPELYRLVLSPLLTRIGSRWRHGEEPVWDEHFASATVRTIVEALYPRVRTLVDAVPRSGRVALLACPAQEQHELGLRMLADRFELSGWTAYFLGADVPATECAAAARTLDAELIALSAATLYHRAALRGYVEELQALVPDIRIVVRGPAFETAEDGWALHLTIDEAELLGGGA